MSDLPPPPTPQVPPPSSEENSPPPPPSTPPQPELSEAEKIRAGYKDVYLGEEAKPLTAENERIYAMIIHLSGLLKYFTVGASLAVPIVFWVLFQNKSEFIKKQAEKGFILQLAVSLSYVLLICLGTLLSVILIGFLFYLLIPVVIIVDIVFIVLHTMAIKDHGKGST
ncbi:MAG: DUF4870 domain-containing protein [Candidatus Sumerlaeia bacterium]|nr:DUF4870 domain-containing protein [Candidatus Sumerlaeia bacterium]